LKQVLPVKPLIGNRNYPPTSSPPLRKKVSATRTIGPTDWTSRSKGLVLSPMPLAAARRNWRNSPF